MRIASLLTADTVAVYTRAPSKKRLLELLSQMLAKGAESLDAHRIFESLIDRERLGSTGLGHGVAIPHGRMEATPTAVGAFIQLREPIDFEAPDGEPVDLIFALLVPAESTDEHLQILSRLAELFSDKAYCARLRTATESATLLDLLTASDEPRASTQTT